jgi:hypothetical protein
MIVLHPPPFTSGREIIVLHQPPFTSGLEMIVLYSHNALNNTRRLSLFLFWSGNDWRMIV